MEHVSNRKTILFYNEIEKNIRVIRNEYIRKNRGMNNIPSIDHPSKIADILDFLFNRIHDEPTVKHRTPAHAALWEISTAVSKKINKSGNISLNNITSLCEKSIIQEFVFETSEINQEKIDKFISKIKEDAEIKCEDRVYIIPYNLPIKSPPSFIRIGHVLFQNKFNFRKKIMKNLNESRDSLGKIDEKSRVSRLLLSEALRFYRKFEWTAEIEILGCDTEMADFHAKLTAKAAGDVLHLLLGYDQSRFLLVGRPAQIDRGATLTIDADGRLNARTFTSWEQMAQFSGWERKMQDPRWEQALNFCGVALEVAMRPGLDRVRPLSRRFLDAVQWFGDAVREESPAPRLIKHVTALERMVIPEKTDRIAESFALRVAALTCDASDRNSFTLNYNLAKKIYNTRSKLLHGSLSQSAPSLLKESRRSNEFSRNVLLHVSYLLTTDNLKDPRATDRRLSQWYEKIVDACSKT
ncbi:HEPN domain-containing protein (plasmid) [Tistrella mobilis]|uniref:hypothetical protein n=1 Tax=Tistrella mobilis TaxID=171437 RepID=UPI0035574607